MSSHCQSGNRIEGTSEKASDASHRGIENSSCDKQSPPERPHAPIDLRRVFQVESDSATGSAENPAERISSMTRSTGVVRREHDPGSLRREIDARLYPVKSIQLSFDPGCAGSAGHPADREATPGSRRALTSMISATATMP